MPNARARATMAPALSTKRVPATVSVMVTAAATDFAPTPAMKTVIVPRVCVCVKGFCDDPSSDADACDETADCQAGYVCANDLCTGAAGRSLVLRPSQNQKLTKNLTASGNAQKMDAELLGQNC